MVETYKKIEGFENYSVSDFGNVRNNKTGRILKENIMPNGYLHMGLRKDKKQSFHYVHRLVAQAFLPNLERKPRVDHIDNNKGNNNLLNLRWATATEDLRNRQIFKNNKSGIKGVHWSKSMLKWKATLTVNSKKINLGYFENKEDANAMRIQRAQDQFGEFTHKTELVNIV